MLAVLLRGYCTPADSLAELLAHWHYSKASTAFASAPAEESRAAV